MFEINKFDQSGNRENQRLKSAFEVYQSLSAEKKRRLEIKFFGVGIGSEEGIKANFEFWEKEHPKDESLAALMKEFYDTVDDSEAGCYVGKYKDFDGFDFYPVRKIDKTVFDSYVQQDELEMVYEVFEGGGNSRVIQLADDILEKIVR